MGRGKGGGTLGCNRVQSGSIGCKPVQSSAIQCNPARTLVLVRRLWQRRAAPERRRVAEQHGLEEEGAEHAWHLWQGGEM